ncbi:MAG: hypothetical protein JKY53_06460 [Flavobacteriales bacterium]|nr:hypothetical protein [Flavobacteriales bacterium]
MSTLTTTRFIEKEHISELDFPAADVLDSAEKRIFRLKSLHSACEYGNIAQHKVEILFEDETGKKKVETTLWEVTNDAIFLKHNVTIPVNRIWNVRF